LLIVGWSFVFLKRVPADSARPPRGRLLYLSAWEFPALRVCVPS
jgi:hypothetical protein